MGCLDGGVVAGCSDAADLATAGVKATGVALSLSLVAFNVRTPNMQDAINTASAPAITFNFQVSPVS